MIDINDTLSQRAKTHGDYEDHALYTQQIKEIIRNSVSYKRLSTDQIETLDMISHKIGRILAGDPDFFDHWHDIAGYATLSANLCSDAPGKPDAKKEVNEPEEEPNTGRFQVKYDDDTNTYYVDDTKTGVIIATRYVYSLNAYRMADKLNAK